MHERPYWWRSDDHPQPGFYGGDRRAQHRRGERPYWWTGHDLPPRDDHFHIEEQRRNESYENAYRGYDDTASAQYYDDRRARDHDDLRRTGERRDDQYHHEERRRPRWARKMKALLGSDRRDRRDHHHLDRGDYNERRDFRGVGPQTRHEEDEDLRDMICQRLSDDPNLDASNVIVRVIDNEAILDGSVRSREDAQHLYETALDVPGIVHVRDRVQVVGRGRDRVRRATIGMGYEESRRRLS